ncbi:hypothetical protein HPB50_011302 [Hyalomma asiaticum]|uniref:Uncharacterized protein n=1 Tax=Hyalomma asiaticum TaxID=266040 RepID=A0ACB7RTM1_HYAAI|nr:hypothetical protein HPB50_011302 [Hyalomma asiaticum]
MTQYEPVPSETCGDSQEEARAAFENLDLVKSYLSGYTINYRRLCTRSEGRVFHIFRGIGL